MIGLLSAALVAAMLPGVAAAKDKDKDKSECKKGGWRDRLDASGRPFADQGECVAYVSQGGGVPRLAEPITIAIAYSNQDATPGYDPSSDTMIAELLAIDGNGPHSSLTQRLEQVRRLYHQQPSPEGCPPGSASPSGWPQRIAAEPSRGIIRAPVLSRLPTGPYAHVTLLGNGLRPTCSVRP